MAFVVSENQLHARDIENDAHFEGLTVSKERVYAYCLHWKNKKIMIEARRQSVANPQGAGERWVIQSVGSIHKYYPAYECSSKEEFLEVLQLAIAAFKVIPPGVDGRLAVSVDLSEHITRLAQNFPLAT